MDYLQLERERGITIQSAVISLPWKGVQINLIDTPGHVDFQVEVERAVRVLDGAVTILDAVNGVQAQTLSVWKQANRYSVPRITFLNKMDREGASYEKSVESMIAKLEANPILIQIPTGPNFSGVVDLVEMKVYEWPEVNSTSFTTENIKEDHPAYDLALTMRTKMIEKLAEADDNIMELYLEHGDTIDQHAIRDAIIRSTHSLKITPVLMGSGFKTRGIQPLLDAIIAYLPSPDNRPPIYGTMMKNNKEKMKIEHDHEGSKQLCALAFKVVNDRHRGMLTYLRVYSGCFHAGDKVYNTNRDVEEKALNVFRIEADHMGMIPEIRAGDIGAVVGLRNTYTGDTIVSRDKKGIYREMKLEGVAISPPVFTCAIEPNTQKDVDPLKDALNSLRFEDPSIHITQNEETKQTLISGMGELHMEIIRDRILNHYKVNATMGRMQISYRCSISTSVTKEHHYHFEFAGKKKYAGLVVEVSPSSGDAENSVVDVIPEEDLLEISATELPSIKDSIISGVEAALRSGPLLSFQVTNVNVKILRLMYKAESSPASVQACAIQAVLQAVKEAEPYILQPIMSMEMYVPDKFVNGVISDVTSIRKGILVSVEPEYNGKVINVEVPLRNIIGYSTHLRSITQGAATYTTEFLCYREVSFSEKETLMKELRGF